VRLTIQDRDCISHVAEVPKDCPVLIGQIPLESAGPYVFARRSGLRSNPDTAGSTTWSKRFQGDLTNQDGTVLGDFRHVADAIAILDRQAHGAVHLQGDGTGAGCGRGGYDMAVARAVRSSASHRQARGSPCRRDGVLDFHARTCSGGSSPRSTVMEIVQVFDLHGDDYPCHRVHLPCVALRRAPKGRMHRHSTTLSILPGVGQRWPEMEPLVCASQTFTVPS